VPRSVSGIWNPPKELLALRERLAEVFDTEGSDASRAAMQWTPPVDVTADEERVVASFELPGVRPPSVSVRIEDKLLTVRGERSRRAGTQVHHIERAMGAFERTVTLPVEVRASAAIARLERGVLTVVFPRGAAEAGVRAIAVAE